MSPSLEQFSCGLDTYGLLQLVRNKKKLFQPVFCQSECLKWELETFEDMLEPNYSESGSSKKSLEIHSMKVFNDAIEKIYDEGILYALYPIKSICLLVRAAFPSVMTRNLFSI